MSWPSSSSSVTSETYPHEITVTEPEPWGHHGPVRGADEGDWFGAFHNPRNGLAVDEPDEQAGSLEERWSSAQDTTTDPQLQNCISCGTATQNLWQLSCGHWWGRSCLLARIELALQWEGNWPAKCCQKINDVEMRDLAPFLGQSMVQKYIDKYDEMETPRDQRIYCGNPRCSTFLGRKGIGVHLDSCLMCGTSTCLACGKVEPLHDHDECPSEAAVMPHQELIRSGNLQQCPGCPEVVELREACNHIT